MIEVEDYRRTAERAVGRVVDEVVAPDDWYLKGGTTAAALGAALRGAQITGARRIGKLLLVDTDQAVLGLRFGATELRNLRSGTELAYAMLRQRLLATEPNR